MRKLIVQQFTTVDGYAADSDGGMNFVSGKPYDESNDELFKAEAMAFVDSVDTMILGANTYKMFAGYWPTAASNGEGAFADKINQLQKYVASTTLTAAPWSGQHDATITSDPIGTITELKEQTGKDIVLWGSLTLMHDLFDAGIVDEVQLRVCPTTRGAGAPMFTQQLELELIESKAYERGVLVSKYRVLS